MSYNHAYVRVLFSDRNSRFFNGQKSHVGEKG